MALFWGMVVRPRATLTYLRDAGGLSWLWPAGLAMVVLVASMALVAPISRRAAQAEMDAMRERFGENMTPAQQAQIEQMAQLVGSPLFTVVIPAITGVIGLAVGWLIRGGALYLLGLLFGGKPKFGPMFRMAVWTSLPNVLRQWVTTAGTLATGRVLTSGLAFLAPAPVAGTIPEVGPGLWRAFLGGIDVYWLWAMALTTIGVAVTASFSLRKGLVVTLVYWLLTLLLSLGWLWISLTLAGQAGFFAG